MHPRPNTAALLRLSTLWRRYLRGRGALIRTINRIVGGVHVRLYRLTAGRVGGTLLGMPILLLTVRGRRTGHRRTTALSFARDGDTYLVLAGGSGSPHLPGWWINLRASGTADVQVGARRLRVRAHAASPEEDARLWAVLVEQVGPHVAGYRAGLDRTVPLVVLEPMMDGAAVR